MLRFRPVAIGAVVWLIGCASEEATSTPPAPEPAPPAVESRCADGFAEDADGACIDIGSGAHATCAAGTRPRLGTKSCEPVGWTSACPTGTTRDASGFGCVEPAPRAICTGATREAYGAATCTAVGDCGAAFPPAGAIVVDAAFADGQLDATHVRSITDAVAIAGDGATIAVETGAYDEAITIAKQVTVIGRCAEKVELRSPAGSVKPGIDVRAMGVTVRGLTLIGHVDAFSVSKGARASVESIVVRGARHAGLFIDGGNATIRSIKVEDTVPSADGRGGYDVAVGAGGEAAIEDSTIAGGIQGVFSGANGRLALTRVVITRQAPNPTSKMRPAGVAVVTGARVTLSRSVIRDLEADGAVVTEADGTAELTETIVHGIRSSGAAARGYGLLATYGGHVIARSSMVADAELNAIMARDEGSSLELASVTVLGPKPIAQPVGDLVSDGRGGGVGVLGKAKGSLDGVAILGAWGFGAYADSGATLEMKRSFMDATRAPQGADPARGFAVGLTINGASGLVSDITVTRSASAGITVGKKGQLRGDRVLVRDVIEGAKNATGAGLSVGAGGNVDLDASAIDSATATGVLVTGDGGSYVRLARSSIHGTRRARDGFGHGITVRLDASVVLEGTSVVDNPGIGVAADGGRALVGSAAIVRNAVGIHAQGGSFLKEIEDADPESLEDGEVRVAPSTRFVANGSRVGSGIVPLPAPALP